MEYTITVTEEELGVVARAEARIAALEERLAKLEVALLK